VMFAPSPMWVAGYELSTVAVPTEQMGRRAVQMLRQKLQEPDVACASEPIRYALDGGRTVGAAPAARSM